MLARFQCLPKIVLKKVQNKNSIPTAKMTPPPKKKRTKKIKKAKYKFSKQCFTIRISAILILTDTDSLKNALIITDSLKNALIIKH